jgi:integrase/recombinase XerD
MKSTLGSVLHAFFEDHLKLQKGFQATSIRSYRDTVRLFLSFVAKEQRRRITQLELQDLTFDRAQSFLLHLEKERHNQARTRNQRLAVLRTFFDYVACRVPEMLPTGQQVALIPVKRTHPAEMHFLDKQELTGLFRSLPANGRHAVRDRTLLCFLYNTGARVQEVVELRRKHLDLGESPRVQLHGKGDKWRTCPLWLETATQLKVLLDQQPEGPATDGPVFVSRPGQPLTRFGIYKIVRRLCNRLDQGGTHPRRVSPHLFRHTAAVHLLESGVDINVIRGWLGHVSLETTNRYAEITVRMKEAALKTCEAPVDSSARVHRNIRWKDDEALLTWLHSL